MCIRWFTPSYRMATSVINSRQGFNTNTAKTTLGAIAKRFARQLVDVLTYLDLSSTVYITPQ